MAYLEEVFRLSGIPTYTFVQPDRYDEIKVSVRTPGRCLVLEGPSGIGKTTTITKVVADLGISAQVLSLSARKQSTAAHRRSPSRSRAPCSRPGRSGEPRHNRPHSQAPATPRRPE